MKRRILCVLIALALCLGLAPGTAWAAGTPTRTETLDLREGKYNQEDSVSQGWNWEITGEKSGTLTLTNCHIKADSSPLLIFPAYYTVTIILEGDNTLETAAATWAGMVVYKDEENHGIENEAHSIIQGSGSLALIGSGSAFGFSGEQLTIKSGTITTENAGLCTILGDFMLEGGSVTVRQQQADESGIYIATADTHILGGTLDIEADIGIWATGTPNAAAGSVYISGGSVTIKSKRYGILVNFSDESNQDPLRQAFYMTGGTLDIQSGGLGLYAQTVDINGPNAVIAAQSESNIALYGRKSLAVSRVKKLSALSKTASAFRAGLEEPVLPGDEGGYSYAISVSEDASAEGAVKWEGGTPAFEKWKYLAIEAEELLPAAVTVSPQTLSLAVGEERQLTATVLPAGVNQSVTWASSNPAAATVDESGNVTAVGAGSAVITVTTADGGHTAACEVTVVPPTVPVTGVSLDKASLSLFAGTSERLTAAVSPGDATNQAVTWATSDPAVATVDSSGKVTAVGAGTAVISATTEDGGWIAACTVTVKEAVVLPDPPAGDGGTKFQLVMEQGISQVPAGLQSIETLNTPAKLEAVLKTEITKVTPGIPQTNTAVYDVVLLVSTDGGRTWTPATRDNFPSGGLTFTLPYPAGTNSSYRFTVVHMFTTSDFGRQPGETEVFTPDQVKNTANGIQVTVTGLSPISAGWTAPAVMPETPPSGSDGGWENEDTGSAVTYGVTIEKPEHGKVTTDRASAASGNRVTLTVTPDSGYTLDTLTVTDSRGNEIKLTARGGGKYTFTMPGRDVTVKSSFAPLPEDAQKPCDGGTRCPSRAFTDLGSAEAWYHEAVDYVLKSGLMDGFGNGLFGPDYPLTRAQFAQILYNKEGRPAAAGGSSFRDVASNAWCAPAAAWASERGIAGGYGNR